MLDTQLTPDLRYADILTAFIQRFVRLVGAPMALRVARKIPNLVVDDDGQVQAYDPDRPGQTLMLLLQGYEAVFGEAVLHLSLQAAISAASLADAPREEAPPAPALLPVTRPIRILVVDDHVLFREGLVRLIKPEPDMRVVGQAGSVREAIRLAEQLAPTIVLMDYSLPDGTGQDAIAPILAACPETRVVFLTVHEDDESLFGVLRAGAKGYVLKNVDSTELLDKLRTVAKGEAGLSPALTNRVLEAFRQMPAAPLTQPQLSELTHREMEIIREVAQGASNQEIARHLVISENTVKKHLANVFEKLHLSSRRDLANFVHALGAG